MNAEAQAKPPSSKYEDPTLGSKACKKEGILEVVCCSWDPSVLMWSSGPLVLALPTPNRSADGALYGGSPQAVALSPRMIFSMEAPVTWDQQLSKILLMIDILRDLL